MLIRVVIYSKPSHPHNSIHGMMVEKSNFKIQFANYDRPDSTGRRNRHSVQQSPSSA